MIPHTKNTPKHIRLITLLSASALSIYGCSGSSNSEVRDIGTVTVPGIEAEPDIIIDDSDILNQEPDTTTDVDTISEAPVSNGNTDSNAPEAVAEAPVVDNPSTDIPDPVLPLTTRVNFEITVPAYSSEELQVRVVWGDIDQTAAWVGDEYWTTSLELPLDTEHELVVTFYDKNGDVTLASYESTLKTGFNPAESVQIYASQFDSDRWDTDADGISNLDESIMGGDSTQLELRESYFSFDFDFGTSTYESQITDERPYYEYIDVEPYFEDRPEWARRWGTTQVLTIDIDGAGTGTLDDYDSNYAGSDDTTTWLYAATRTNTGDSVIWDGNSSRYHSDGVTSTFKSSVEVKRVNAQSLSASGSYRFHWSGNSPSTLQVYEYTFTGKTLTDSPACEPTSGILTHKAIKFEPREQVWVETFSTLYKGTNDQFWTVAESAVKSESYPSDSAGGAGETAVDADIVNTYLVRTLSATFYCDYPELR